MARILIVDDSRAIHMMLGARLRAEGHEVVGMALDGLQGAALFRETRPDLVLMDITMPNADGREALKLVLECDPAARVLMLSALNAPELVEQCLKIGARGYLSKERLKDKGYLEAQVSEQLGLSAARGTENNVRNAA